MSDTSTARAIDISELVSSLNQARDQLFADRVAAGKAEPTEQDEREFARSYLRKEVRERNVALLAEGRIALTDEAAEDLIDNAFVTTFHGSGLIRAWEENPTAENMAVFGTNPARMEFPGGHVIELPPVARSHEELIASTRLLRRRSNAPDTPWDTQNFSLELVLDDGTRVTGVRHITGEPFVTLRRATIPEVTLDQLASTYNGMSVQCAELLKACVRAKFRILVTGSMNTGKTVLMRALAASLPSTAVLLTVESKGELRLDQFPDTYPKMTVPMEARAPNSQGDNGVSLRDCVTEAQRMSPDAVIIGEIRGSEITAFAAAAGQGYQVAATIHGLSAVDGLKNAALYYREHTGTTEQVALSRMAQGVDVVMHMSYVDGRRFVDEVVAIGDLIDGNVKFEALYRDELGITGVPPTTHDRALRQADYAHSEYRA